MLTLTVQLLRIVGIFFTAYLTRKIGAEGVGLYQLILSVYFLAATLASSGIGTTVARLVAESLGKSGGKSISDVLRKATTASAMLGIAVGAAIFLLAEFIGTSLLGDIRAVPAIRMLAAGMPFIAMSSCLQGYFYGVRKTLAPSSEMIFEQLLRILLIMAVLDIFIPKGLSSSCFAVILCCMISETLSCAFAFVLYIAEIRRSALRVTREAGITKKMAHIALPLALSGYLRSALKTAENVLIPSGLRSFGASEGEALSQYARIGMASPVLFFPSGVLGSAATLLMPEISEARTAKNESKVKRIFSRTFQLTVLFSLLFGTMFMVCGSDLGFLIYGCAEAGTLIAALAPLVPLMYLDFVVDALMTGLGQQMKTLRVNTFDYAIRIGLILLLIPKYGFAAYVCILYFSTFFNAVLSVRNLLIASGARIHYAEWVVKPLLSAAGAGGAAVLYRKMLPPGDGILGVTLQIIFITAAYIVMVVLLRCITREDWAWMRGVVHGAKKRRE